MGQFESYDEPPPYSASVQRAANPYSSHGLPRQPYGQYQQSVPQQPAETAAYTSANNQYAVPQFNGNHQTFPGPNNFQAVQQPPLTASPSPSPSSQSDDVELDEIAAHYRRYIQPRPAGGFFSDSSPPSSQLSRPILIPQAFAVSFHQPPAPFLRAYPPVLSTPDIGIPPALFVAILDALNLCLAPPPPLQALEIVGQGVGFIPHHIAQGVSAGIGVVAGVGVAATRITRLKKFLTKVNADVFSPRGLVMEVVKDEAALRLAGVEASRLPQVPPANTPLNAAVHARLTQLAPYTAPLSFDVPPPAVPKGLMDRISARQAASRVAKDAKKGEKQLQKREDKLRKMETRMGGRLERRSSSDSDSSDDRSDDRSSVDGASIHAMFDRRRQEAEQRGDWKEVAKIEKKRAKEMEDFHKKQQKRERKQNKHGDRYEDKQQKKYDKDLRKLDKKEQKQDEKDQKKMAKLQWIVIKRADVGQ